MYLQEKHVQAEAHMDSASNDDSVVGALRNGVVTEVLAAQVHRMLKSNLTARKKWLGGMPLHLALLESPSPPRSGHSLPTATPRTLTPPISEHHEMWGSAGSEMM